MTDETSGEGSSGVEARYLARPTVPKDLLDRKDEIYEGFHGKVEELGLSGHEIHYDYCGFLRKLPPDMPIFRGTDYQPEEPFFYFNEDWTFNLKKAVGHGRSNFYKKRERPVLLRTTVGDLLKFAVDTTDTLNQRKNITRRGYNMGVNEVVAQGNTVENLKINPGRIGDLQKCKDRDPSFETPQLKVVIYRLEKE